MPIYEYACRQCGAHFEKLVRNGEAVACPSCQSARVGRLLSLVGVRTTAAGGAEPQMGMGGGGCCGGGGCGCH